MVGNFPAVLNFNRLFLKFNQFICNNCRFSPIIESINQAEIAWCKY